MTIPRRQVLRPRSVNANEDFRRQARHQRQRAELTRCRSGLKRWLSRLKRATNTVTALHGRIARLEEQLG